MHLPLLCFLLLNPIPCCFLLLSFLTNFVIYKISLDLIIHAIIACPFTKTNIVPLSTLSSYHLVHSQTPLQSYGITTSMSMGGSQVPLSPKQPVPNEDGGGSSSSSAGGPSPTDGAAKDLRQRARVLYDYDAKDSTELSLMADEVIIIVEEEYGPEPDYAIGERGSQRGKVPKAYLEMLSY
ncbi:hypothetical protein J437_LFUL017557 [Ladona fulva]|uniref:SH3 domain-containing protein n=1 Tax=Ladona fulva TaxID=123851 RepID=A0A8K0PA89_LADFU|nr:hypothetical protein J437_LFUL017557 [Ladona fulva]